MSSITGNSTTDQCYVDFLTFLPLELHEKIIKYFSLKDILNCSLVSRSWRDLVNSDFFWKRRCTEKLYGTEIKDAVDEAWGISTLNPLCDWRIVYMCNNRLKNNWKGKRFEEHHLSKNLGSLFCLDSDGTRLAVGHADSCVNIWKIDREPIFINTFCGILYSSPVKNVKIYKNFVVLLQKKLLQIFDYDGSYCVRNVISFEMGPDYVNLNNKLLSLKEKFDSWYKECLRINDNNDVRNEKVIFSVVKGLVFACLSGCVVLGVWQLDNGKPHASLSGFKSIQEILTVDEEVYIVSKDSSTVLSEYSFERKEIRPVLRTAGWKDMSVTREYIIAAPNRLDTTLRCLRVWDRGCKLLATRKLDFGSLALASSAGLVLYAVNSRLTVWRPDSDQVMATLEFDSAVAWLRPIFSSLAVLFIDGCLQVVDFLQGRHHRLFSQPDSGTRDLREKLWISPFMMVSAGGEGGVKLLTFT